MENSSAIASEIGKTVEEPSISTVPESAGVSEGEGAGASAGASDWLEHPANALTVRTITINNMTNFDFFIFCKFPFQCVFVVCILILTELLVGCVL
jgi:hypothetical protein